MTDAQQPIGFSRRRALWLLATRGGSDLRASCAVAASWLVLIGLLALLGFVTMAILVAIVGLGIAAPSGFVGWRAWADRPRDRITAERQPGLYQLVAQSAQRLMVKPPDRIWLIGTPEVVGTVTLRFSSAVRRELAIGWPLAAQLGRRELSALIIRELAKLHGDDTLLVPRLLTLRHRVATVRLPNGWPRLVRRLVASWRDGYLRITAALVRNSELGSDTAAANTLRSDDVATALLRSSAVAESFGRFVHEYAAPMTLAGYYPADALSGWQWKLVADGGRDRELLRLRPGDVKSDPDSPLPPLIARITAIRPGYPGTITLDAVRDPVPLGSLSEQDESRLSRAALRRLLPGGLAARCRPITFAAAPDNVLDAHTLLLGDELQRAAERVMGEALTPAAALAVVGERYPEVVAEVSGVDDFAGPLPLLRTGLIAQLARYGLRAEFPLRRHIRVLPDGERIDVPALLANDPHLVSAIPALLARLATARAGPAHVR